MNHELQALDSLDPEQEWEYLPRGVEVLMINIQREYVPGACNISPAEESRRLAAGWMGLALSIVLEGLFVAFAVAPAWRLTVFFPATLAASGFLQVAFHFCAGYGLAGVFNVGADVGKTQSVEQAEAKAKDRAKALQIFGLAALVGVLAAGLAYLV